MPLQQPQQPSQQQQGAAAAGSSAAEVGGNSSSSSSGAAGDEGSWTGQWLPLRRGGVDLSDLLLPGGVLRGPLLVWMQVRDEWDTGVCQQKPNAYGMC
jgi:hypothetical protein